MRNWLDAVVELIQELFHAEFTTTAGRVNVLGMLLSVILVIGLTLSPILEAIVRLIRPTVDLDVPILQLFVAFLAFTIVCAALLGYLERNT